MRKVKFTSPNKDMQVIHLEGPRSFCLPSCTNDSQVLFHMRSVASEIKPRLWAMFNNPSSDGIKINAGLFKDDRNQLDFGSCVFRVYLVGEALWNKTLLYSGSGTKVGLDFRIDLTESNLGNLEVIGERTLFIEADLTRGFKKYKTSLHLNHLGIWDYSLRTKIRLDAVEIEVL